ncbi:MAG: hypothetical protein JKY66_03970 [Spongiibacteraceae bacterium]|nr:hypothetical protein [Spongiibacteraceae bacterium]
MSESIKGLPGLRGTDHIGFTVPNLEEAVEFFIDVIGCEPCYELGPFSADDDWMQTTLNVHPRTVMEKLKFLRCKTDRTSRSLSIPRRTRIPGNPETVMSAAIIWPFMSTTLTRRLISSKARM